MRKQVSVICVCFLSFGCASIPWSVERGYLEIAAVRRAIECDLAAVAQKNEFDFVKNWDVKSSLDLTVITAAGVDGKIAWVIPHAPTPTFGVDPSTGIAGSNKSIAHIDFVTSIPNAIANFAANGCEFSDDPSGVQLGLAAWFESTLRAVRAGQHAGMSFTSEFEVVANAGARFGYTITRFVADAGPSISRTKSNRLTVAAAPPAPPSGPIEVVVVGTVDPKLQSPANVIRPTRSQRARDNITLDRILGRKSPVDLEQRGVR